MAKLSSPRSRWTKYVLIIVLLLIIWAVVHWLLSGNSSDSSSSPKSQTSSQSTKNASGTGGQGAKGGMPGAGGRGGRGGQTVVVSTVVAQLRDMNLILSGLGTAQPSSTISVRSQVSGTITKIYFEEGQEVKEGDPLFEIDPRSYQAKLQQTQAELAENNAQLATARQDLKRYQVLYKQDSVARQTLDTQVNLVNQYVATQKSLQAQVDSAKVDLSYTHITAPAAGRLGLRTVDLGNLVAANGDDALVTITQITPIDVVFSLSETQIAPVAQAFYAGQPLVVEVYDRDNKTKIATGTLLSMDNAIDTTTGTVKLKARFANADHQLFPNQFVNVRIVAQHIPQTLSIDTDSIQYGKEGAFVYSVQKDNTVKTQLIQVGVTENQYTQVLSGLKQGDVVVLEGVDRLKEGSKVELAK